MTRLVRFTIVGALGFAVQLWVLVMLDRAGWPVALATLLAVEAAVLHNFTWHERWTWGDVRAGDWQGRLARFHVTNGVLSLAANALVTAGLARLRVPLPIASACAVLACAGANVLAAHRFVFCAKTWPTFDGHLQDDRRRVCGAARWMDPGRRPRRTATRTRRRAVHTGLDTPRAGHSSHRQDRPDRVLAMPSA
jgi:putative flippase GtrA